MYGFVLSAHGLWRWVVIVAGIVAVGTALAGWLGKRNWTPAAARTGSAFTISIDVQLLLGLVLYFVLSPLTTSALRDMGAAMQSRELRYFAVEHTTTMLFAFVLAHVAGAMVKRAADPASRYRRALMLYGIAFVLIVAGNPWWRPLFRT